MLSNTSFNQRTIVGFAPRTLAALLIAISLGGCATLIRGPNTEFHIVTEPAGARVESNLDISKGRGKEPEYFSCPTTPCMIEISRRSNFTVNLILDGYHPATVEVTSGFGKGGAGASAAGVATGATGAYLVSYSLLSGLASAMSAVTTLGLSTSATSAGAGSAAATGAAGIGLVFIGVDLASGAMLDVRPNPLVLILVPEDQPVPSPGIELIESEQDLARALDAAKPDHQPTRVDRR